MVRLLIIDDHTIVRHGLRQVVSDAADIHVAAEAGSSAEAIRLLREGSFDMVLLDISLPDKNGIDTLKQIKRDKPALPVIMLSMHAEDEFGVRAMKAGADEYQRKQELTKERLITAIRDVAHDKIEKTVPPEVAARMEGHILGARMQIPGIKVLRLIGEGGMSRVYLASRDKDDEPLVVKILRSEVTQDKRSLARFIEEYNLIERIHSRHVARIHGHGVSEDNAYLVLEFFDGGDLNKRLAGKALAAEEALRIFRELMFALGDIHEQGILHRDLKPQNLMFRSDGSLAIVDFGIAKHIDSIDHTNKGEILGTPRYMSPEQVQGRALDLRTDIYSAGVLLYQMMLGEHLFSGDTAVEVALHHLNTPPPALPERLDRFQRLFDKLLEKDRDARFRNADEVIGYLSRKFYQGN